MSDTQRRWHRYVVLADVPAVGTRVEGFHRRVGAAERHVRDLSMITGGFIRYGYAPIADCPNLVRPVRSDG